MHGAIHAALTIKAAILHNSGFIIDSIFAWAFVGIAHLLGQIIKHPSVSIIEALPYIQTVSLLLASCASTLTIWKITKDIKKGK